MAALRVLVLVDPSPKSVKRLLQRHKVLAVAVVVELESEKALGALARHYNARPLRLPPKLLLDGV